MSVSAMALASVIELQQLQDVTRKQKLELAPGSSPHCVNWLCLMTVLPPKIHQAVHTSFLEISETTDLS